MHRTHHKCRVVTLMYGAHRAGIVLWLVLPLVPRLYLYEAANAPYRQNLAPALFLVPGKVDRSTLGDHGFIEGQEGRGTGGQGSRRTGGWGHGSRGIRVASMMQNVANSSQHCSVDEFQAGTCQAAHTLGTGFLSLPCSPLLSMTPLQIRT